MKVKVINLNEHPKLRATLAKAVARNKKRRATKAKSRSLLAKYWSGHSIMSALWSD
jgi:hypothetical protein